MQADGSPSQAGSARIIVAILASMLIFAVIFLLFRGKTHEEPSGGGPAPVSTEEGAPDRAPRGDADEGDRPAAGPAIPERAAAGELGRGIVLDLIGGEPIAGARVSLHQRELWSPPKILEETTSGPDGRFRLRAPVAAGSRRALRVDKEGFVPFSDTDQGSPSDWPAGERTIYLSPGLRVTGEVVWEDGSPAGSGSGSQLLDLKPVMEGWFSGARGRARFWSNRRLPFEIDDGGRFATVVSSDRVAFEVIGEAFAPAFSEVLELQVGRENHVVIQVTPGESLRGTVKDRDGNPIAGASITCSPQPRDVEPDSWFPFVRAIRRGESDAGGAFEVRGLTDRCRSIHVTHEAHLEHSLSEPWSTREPLEVVLDAGQWLEGRIIAGEQGRQIVEGTLIRLLAGEKLDTFAAAADGRFRTKSFDAGVGEATLTVAGHAAAELSWEAGAGGHDLGEVTLERGRTLEVRVGKADGSPIPGSRVEIRGIDPRGFSTPVLSTFETDGEGRGIAGAIEGTQVEVQIRRIGYAPWKQPVATLEDRNFVEARLERAASVRGRVIGRGEPVFAAEIQVKSEERQGPFRIPSPSRAGVSIPDGRFVLRGMEVGEALVIEVLKKGFPALERSLEPLSPGEERDLGTLALAEGVALLGKVVDEAGRPVAGANVTARVERERFSFGIDAGPWARTDASGRFELEGLAEGSYEVKCSAPGYSQPPAQNVSIGAGEAEMVVFTLTTGLVYEGVVVDERGDPVSGAFVNLRSESGRGSWSSGQSDAGGYFEVTGVSDGPLVAGVHHTDFKAFEVRADSVGALPGRIVLTAGAILE
ncbi:MAG: carboxypeptidase regulatory-like domain-containing protein, partial [Planctomycetota bacterium]